MLRFEEDDLVLFHNRLNDCCRQFLNRIGRIVEVVEVQGCEERGYLVRFPECAEAVMWDHELCRPTARTWIH